MPQKENPVQASAIVALANQAVGLQTTLTLAAQHKEARDGAAWFSEWLALPQLCLGAMAALTIEMISLLQCRQMKPRYPHRSPPQMK